MPRYLLDTNVVSFLIRASSRLLDQRFRAAKNEVVLSSLCEAEVLFGLALLPVNANIRSTATAFLREMDIVAWDSSCAEQYARMAARQQRLGKVLAPIDSLIAAHALSLNLVLVTNDKAFGFVEGLRVEDWTKGPEPA